MDNRGATPVVEKVIVIGLVALVAGGLSATLYGGTVPETRDAVGAELGERVLSLATQRVEQAVPSRGTDVSTSRTVDLPATIDGAAYRIRSDGRWLVLDHPEEDIGGRTRLVVPSTVDRVDGTWDSGATTVVVVESVPDGLAIELREGSP